jgi:hypothetical protein
MATGEDALVDDVNNFRWLRASCYRTVVINLDIPQTELIARPSRKSDHHGAERHHETGLVEAPQ